MCDTTKTMMEPAESAKASEPDASASQLDGLFQVAGELLCIADLQGNIQRLSPAWEQTLGYSLEELLSRNIIDNVHPDDVASTTAAIKLLSTDRRSSEFTHRCRHSNGAYRWIEWRVARDASGRWLYAAAHDLTERMQAEERARQLAALVDKHVDFLGLADLEGRLNFLNDAGRKMVGLSSEQDVSRLHVMDFVTPLQRPWLLNSVLPRARELGHWSGQGQLQRFDNSSRVEVDIHMFVIEGPDGKVGNLAAVMRDITDARHAENALKESEFWLRESQRMSRVGHFVVDLVNDSWTSSSVLNDILGIDASYPRTLSTWTDIAHPDDRESMLTYMTELIASVGRFDREYRIVRVVDEVERWVWGRAEVILDDEGRPFTMVGTVQDVTDRKRAEIEGAKLASQLRQSQKMEAIGRLAGGVAHDFNNLLTGISGNAALALMDLAPDHPAVDLLKDVMAASDRAAALTRQLLAFGRKQIMEPKVLDLNELIDHVRRMLERIIGEDVELAMLSARNLGSVRADSGQLTQIIMNLAVNARDAMPHGGRLTLETTAVEFDEVYCQTHPQTKPGAHACLTVSDTGCGMSPEVKERIFEPFFTTKPTGQGTGLGLATVYGIVKQHGGTVEVDSCPGKGTTFRIYLPVVDAPTQAVATRDASAPPPKGSETILLVEDEPAVLSIAIRLLRRLGYNVIPCANGEEALEVSARFDGTIDLLMTDVVMPGINGRALAMTLAPQRPNMAILFTSGYTPDVVVHHGVFEGEINFIGKPYTVQEVAWKLRKVLDGPRLGLPGAT